MYYVYILESIKGGCRYIGNTGILNADLKNITPVNSLGLTPISTGHFNLFTTRHTKIK